VCVCVCLIVCDPYNSTGGLNPSWSAAPPKKKKKNLLTDFNNSKDEVQQFMAATVECLTLTLRRVLELGTA